MHIAGGGGGRPLGTAQPRIVLFCHSSYSMAVPCHYVPWHSKWWCILRAEASAGWGLFCAMWQPLKPQAPCW